MSTEPRRVLLPAETHRRLKVAASQRGVSIRTLATLAVEAYLERIKDGR